MSTSASTFAWIAFTSLATSGTTVLVQRTGVSPSVRARGFYLEDEAGVLRASLGLDPATGAGSVVLTLFEPTGKKPRIRMIVAPGETLLELNHGDEGGAVWLSCRGEECDLNMFGRLPTGLAHRVQIGAGPETGRLSLHRGRVDDFGGGSGQSMETFFRQPAEGAGTGKK